MATSLSLENDPSLAQGYIKVNGTTAATLTTSGITGNLTGNVTGSLTQGGSLTLATAQTATGTAVNFTSIPSWAKRITIIFQAVSTNGSSSVIVKVGTSSGFVSSGYLGSSESFNYTNGFPIDDIANAAGVRHGYIQLMNITGNSWVSGGSMGRSDATGSYSSGGSVSLASTLTQVQITTGNGTDAFDAGTINISYEG
jgi:hypothetical protein